MNTRELYHRPLTGQQEAMVWCLYSAERMLNTTPIWVASAFWHECLGLMWNSYYRQLSEQLCEQGFFDRRWVRGQWLYSLTDIARANRSEFWSFAQRHIRLSPKPDRDQLSMFSEIDAGNEIPF